MPTSGVERNQELQDRSIYVDARTIEQRIADSLIQHDYFRNVLIAGIVICLFFPSLIVIVVPLSLALYMWWQGKINRFRMPIRYPEWTGQIDPSHYDDNMGARPAAGIEFMGVERVGRTVRRTLEVWASDSDVRTHRVIMGTTGAGKTEKLLSILFNPLCWGSGFSMTDGKAQIDVTAKVFVMAWIFWREDDVLILNYMRGGQDRFKEMVNKPRVGVRKSRISNTWNPFSTANHETINQIIDSIMEKATGDGAQWQAKAINMKNALVQTIAYLRAKGDMLMSVAAIREQMALDNMIKLAMRTDIPPAAAAAIRSYLSSGLPGFSWARAKQGKPQDQETLLQHGYLTGQFTRTLGLMIDTYYDIFGDEIPEFDTTDVILNNRISFTMIPTLEKGVEEAGNLGKMQVASAKMMMAENLGYELEGNFVDVVENRATNTNRPFYYVMDELGYYFAPGIDLMFAQGRSLQVALIAAGQDFQAMAKAHKSEVESMIANTRIKEAMKLEDPKETYEIFQKAAGKAAVARLSGFEASEPNVMLPAGQYHKNQSAAIEEVDRISLQELKRLGPGDSVMIYADKVIRYRSFNLFLKFQFDKRKVNIRINTFLPIAQPDISQIVDKCRHANTEGESVGARMISLLRGGNVTWTSEADRIANSDPLLVNLGMISQALQERKNINAADKGIILFMAALEAMEKEAFIEDEVATEEEEADEEEPSQVQTRTLLAEDSYLNDPPIMEVGVPSWETLSDETVFGEEGAEEAGHRIDLTDSAKEKISEIMVGLSGSERAVTTETVAMETKRISDLIDDACRYKDDREAIDINDLLQSLDLLERELSKKE